MVDKIFEILKEAVAYKPDFICLPEAKDSLLDHCEFNAKERRILFQKCFQQVSL